MLLMSTVAADEMIVVAGVRNNEKVVDGKRGVCLDILGLDV